ncbi:DUF262 domain-containing protein [Faecalimicrobium sp. JNUCC 81]
MAFEAKPGSILNLFRDTDVEQYRIPKYQRAYSWKEEQVKAFCEDLYDAYKSKAEDYFFGAVIMIKDSEKEKIRNVIDGQQRITTFTMLIAQLRNLCEEIIDSLEINNKVKTKYKKQIKQLREQISDLSQCIEFNELNNKTVYKLELSNTDKAFFEEYIRISNKREILNILELIIESIEEEKEILTDFDELDELVSENKKIRSNVISEIQNIKYIDLYNELSKNINFKYDKHKLREDLILKFLDEKLTKYNIKLNDYIKDMEMEVEIEEQENLDIFRSFKYENIKITSHKKIVDAWNVIEDELIRPIINIEDRNEQIEELMSLINTFMKKTHIVTIISTNEDSAYTMFQVLNDRGRSLGIVDLLRPYTLQLLEGSQYSAKVASSWDKLAEKDDCDKYLQAYIESYIKVSSNDKKIHNKYIRKFFEKNISKMDVSKRIDNILNTYDIYEKIKNGEWPYDSDKTSSWNKNRLKQIISRLGYSKSVPLLLAVYDEGTEDDFIKVIEIIERVVFRYITICEKRSTNLINVYYKTIEDIRKSKNIDLKKFEVKMKELLKEQGCSIEDFKIKLDGKKLTYSKSNKKIIQYFLTTIECYYNDYNYNKGNSNILKNPTKTVLNDNNIWIEHIYSQEAREDYKDDYLDSIVNKIGNLVLLEDNNNRKLGNKSFEEKKSGKNYGYDKEKMIITNTLVDLPKWEKDEYIERRNLYIDIAIRVFTLDGE